MHDRSNVQTKAAPIVAPARWSCTSAAFGQLGAQILGAGHGLRFRAHGVSMSPLVRDGDILLVQPVDARALRVSDVVLCKSDEGRVLVHRVIRKKLGEEGSRFTVQGDALCRSDGVIPGEQIYGRVATIERHGAHISMNGPVMQALGGLAALRSRWGVARRGRAQFATQLVKRLPVVSRYLA